jgi:hypothetical protein
MEEIRLLEITEQNVPALYRAVEKYKKMLHTINETSCDVCDSFSACEYCYLQPDDSFFGTCCPEFHDFLRAETDFIRAVKRIIDTGEFALSHYKSQRSIQSVANGGGKP